MRTETVDTMASTLIALIAKRLTHAASLAKAAEVCAASGNTSAALQIAQDIDQPLFEAQNLLNVASLIDRLGSELTPSD